MIFPCEEDDPVRLHFEERGEEFRDRELECEEEEAREPCVLRDPGAPTAELKVERQNVTHMPFRSWCPACVEGKARDKHLRKVEGQVGEEMPEIVFDCCFLVSEGEDTVAIQVTRDRPRMILVHVVPKKGFSHEHGAHGVDQGYRQVGLQLILKCDGEPALKTIQEEVRRQRSEKTILENSPSPVGDSQANGAAERAVQAIAEQVRVIRRGLEQRLELRLSGKHPVTARLVERAADLLSKCQVGDDGKTGHELARRSTTSRIEGQGQVEQVGNSWAVGGAQAKPLSGHVLAFSRAGTVRRVGAHRPWNCDGLEHVRGSPWQRDPAQGDVHPRSEGEMVG